MAKHIASLANHGMYQSIRITFIDKDAVTAESAIDTKYFSPYQQQYLDSLIKKGIVVASEDKLYFDCDAETLEFLKQRKLSLIILCVSIGIIIVMLLMAVLIAKPSPDTNEYFKEKTYDEPFKKTRK